MWVKICGLTSLENAREVVKFQPDAVGLNFYAQSKRCVDVETAKAIVDSLPNTILPVGLFVNHAIEQIREICGTCGIRTVQLHGDEPAAFASQLNEYRIVRAIRVDESTIDHLETEIESYLAADVNLFGVLVDSRVNESYGGTGHTAPWDLIKDRYDKERWPPLVLAGGLDPENVSMAIESVAPWGVDVASGVENAPGIKDRDLVERFLSNARAS